MIDNQYIYELDIDLDMAYLTAMVKRLQFARVPGLAGHQRVVADEPYMSSIREQLPILATIFNIYTLKPGVGIPMHIDAGRQCAFNIPISGTANTSTIFYKHITANSAALENIPDKVYNIVKSPVKETYRFTFLNPVLIDNTGPHEVTSASVVDRVSISWSVHRNVTFEQAKDAFKKYSQNKRA